VKVATTDQSIHIQIDLPVRPMEAWRLVTEKRHIANWWGEHVDLKARPGGTLVERWSDGRRTVITLGHVTRCDPPHALELTWADDDWPGHTAVGFHLSAYGGGTRLALDHSGWGVHPAGERKSLIDAHAGGWSRYLARLADYAADRGPSRRRARRARPTITSQRLPRTRRAGAP
jgi:uncharacterized protein YndB with AHSA1/START domain